MTTLRDAALALACLAAAAAAQQPTGEPRAPRARQTTSTAVHEAWLREVMDLDVAGAVQAYDRIRREAPKAEPERWLAVTRLAELYRLGVTTPEPAPIPPVPSLQAPPEVRAALEELVPPVAIEDVLSDPLAELRLPPLHPATRDVQDWARNQLGPSVDERLRLRFRRRPGPRTSERERWYAADILRVELTSRPAQAQALRTLYFANWQEPRPAGDPAQVLAEVRERLARWLADEQTSAPQRALLTALGEAIDERAATSPKDAIDFVARMPLYAERLLLGQAWTDTPAGEPATRR